MFSPSYLKLHESGELEKRINKAYNILEKCSLCPHGCRVNRTKKEKGFCKSLVDPVVSSYNAHHGEEPPISGIYGSGTIFFTHCTMRCVFCQNYPISQMGQGKTVSVDDVAFMMIYLQKKNCHNINFVTPTHYVPQILKALNKAIMKGFHLPLVYNTSGYETIETLELLDGIIDIYLPDMKYADPGVALKYSGIKNYPEYNQKAIMEMYRQTGDLKTDRMGIGQKGVLIRHLVLPYGLAGSKKILDFLKKKVSTTITIGIMSQYFPAHKACENPHLKYRLTPEEYQKVVDYAIKLGFKNLLIQGH
ncbi:MAG: radical SAM protein [Spirochaetes bacterium]|nr:radical SAM protein [Spirochaetota bacterium]